MAATVEAMLGGLRALTRVAAGGGLAAGSVGPELPMLEASGLVRRSDGQVVLSDRLTGILEGLLPRPEDRPRAD